MFVRRAGIFAISAALGVGVACSGAFSGDVAAPDASPAPTGDRPQNIAPDVGPTEDGAIRPEEDSGADGAPTYTFSDDFERPDGALVPPWEETNVTRGVLSIQGPDGGRSRFLSSDTEIGAGSQASCVRGFRANVLRSEATFKLRIAGFDQSDGGTGETLNLLSFRLDTGGPDGGAGPGHTIRVGLKKRSTTRFALFVMSQFEATQTRSNDSSLLLELGRDYEIRFFSDASTPRPGVPVARALVDGVEAVTLDGAGERVYDHLPVGRIFFPGGTQGGSGFHVELDDFSFVGRP